MESYDLIVIGGGPAGFFSALSAANANPDLRILILEKGSKLLRKVRISGGGRCNVTHACFDPAELVGFYPRGGRELRGPFSRFQPGDTIEWFESRGVKLKAEADGRMFPASDDSTDIVDCLLNEARRNGITIHTRANVTGISRSEAGYRLTLLDGDQLTARNLLIAAGGGSDPIYRLIRSLGHTIVLPVPSLFTFEITDSRLEGLAGVTVLQVSLSIPDPESRRSPAIESTGPLLVTHWGVSGPAVLKLSAWGARTLANTGYHLPLTVNWLPTETQDSAFKLLRQNKIISPRQQIGSHPPADLPSRLWQRLVDAAGIPLHQPWTEISDKKLQFLAKELVAGEFQISGKGVFKEEFVTCGGVSLREVDFRTMESKISPGLHFAGEVLDIDGITGGFNFQACWTTGYLAGQGITKDS
jgi:predicted Rossmann fold flavoprotein